MIRKIFEKNKGGKIASLSQIFVLVLGIVAISYALGSEIKEVSGANPFFPDPTVTVFQGINAPFGNPFPFAPTSFSDPLNPSLLFNPSAGGNAAVGQAAPAAAANLGVWQVLGNFAMAVMLYFATYALLQTLGVNQEALVPTSLVAAIAYFFGSTFSVEISAALGITQLTTALGLFGPFAIGMGAALVFGGIALLLSYRVSERETIIFSCNPWQPPAKGEDCRKCGKGILACTKYQCQSLGAGCKLVNEGMSDERCDWVNPNDIDPPLITPWAEILKADYKYTPDNAVSPPDKGVILKYKNGDLPAFKAISFGVHLQDEKGKEKLGMCRASVTRKDSFDNMEIPLSNLEYLENHTIEMSFPGVVNAAAEGLNNLKEGENVLYIRCKSTNGIPNTADFVIKFNIEKGPDTTPPEIFLTNPLNGVPVQHGTMNVTANFYINEPSDCKWSYSDRSYDSMENSMTCEHSLLNPTYFGGQITFPCTTFLTGLTDSENKIYLRCKDQPIGVADNLRNTMSQSYVYTLRGTQTLVINSAGPSGIVKGPGSSIKVNLTAETTAGFSEGKASCYYNEKCYNPSGNAENYILFSYPVGTQLFSQFKHSQELHLPAGSYDCSIKCIDLGGNSDTKTISYSIEADNAAPSVARIYYESPGLKVITNEPSECVYDTSQGYDSSKCTYIFADGLKMADSSDGLSHSVEWDARTVFYIKCMDNYGNQPNSNVCSAVVRPV